MNIATVSNVFNILIIILCIFSSHVNKVACLEGPIKGLNKYKEIVKTYQNEYGDIFDCVNIHHQPAFEHPLLINHLIQKSSFKRLHKSARCRRSKHFDVQNVQNASQYCPKGTIPIIRSYKQNTEIELNDKDEKSKSIEYAHVGTRSEIRRIFGANATLQYASPKVHFEEEYSLAHVLLVTHYTTKSQKSIEAGWAIHYAEPRSPPRFFIRWTNDGYRLSGCFNLDCPGFIQTNPNIVIGGVLRTRDPIVIEIYYDPNEQNWYLFKDCIEVGYWPMKIFTNLQHGFQRAFFGGEIINTQKLKYHTHTEMGNGRYGTEGEGHAAAMHHIQVWPDLNDLNFYDLDEHELSMYLPHCYNVTVQNPHPTLGGFSLYYGGPGFDRKFCRNMTELLAPPPSSKNFS